MKNIKMILDEFGITLTDEQLVNIEKAVSENYKTIAEVEKKTLKAEKEIESLENQLETASETLKGFEGIDPKEITGQLETYKTKMTELEENHKKELYQRDFSDILSKEIENYKFSSSLAKEMVAKKIQDAELKLVDGKIIGFKDMIDSIKTNHSDAFISETTEELQKNKAVFTSGVSPSTNTSSDSKDPNNMDTESYMAWRKLNP